MRKDEETACLALLAQMRREAGGAEVVNAAHFVATYELFVLTGENPNVREGRWYAHPERDYRPRKEGAR